MKKINLIIVPVLILVVWIILTSIGFINPLFLPSPRDTLASLIMLIFTGSIFPDIIATLVRMFLGFFISVIIGVPLGLCMGYFKSMYLSFEFLIDFFRSLPVIALFPLFLLFFGIGDTSKIAVVIFGCFFVILINTIYGVRNVKQLRLVMAKTFNINKLNMFTRIVLPESLPYIFVGLRVAISMALVLVIVTEMFVGTTLGLGNRLINAQLMYRVPELYSSIIIVGCLGYLINKLFFLIEKKVIHWSGK